LTQIFEEAHYLQLTIYERLLESHRQRKSHIVNRKFAPGFGLESNVSWGILSA